MGSDFESEGAEVCEAEGKETSSVFHQERESQSINRPSGVGAALHRNQPTTSCRSRRTEEGAFFRYYGWLLYALVIDRKNR